LYLGMMLPILLYLRLSSGRRQGQLLWNGGLLLATACLAVTFSRSGYIAAFIATLMFFVRWHRLAFRGALVVGIVLIVMAELSGSPRFSVRGIVTSPQAVRMVELYAAVLSAPPEDLLLGVSWRNWHTALEGALPPIQDELRMGLVSLPRTLKNMYLTFLVEHGVVGLFFVLLVFITALKTVYEGSIGLSEHSLRPLLWAIFSSALGFMVNMLFFDSAYFIAVQVTFWLLLGLGVGITLVFERSALRSYRWLETQLMVEMERSAEPAADQTGGGGTYRSQGERSGVGA